MPDFTLLLGFLQSLVCLGPYEPEARLGEQAAEDFLKGGVRVGDLVGSCGGRVVGVAMVDCGEGGGGGGGMSRDGGG